MDFKKELQTLSENFASDKLDRVKEMLKKAASEGTVTTTIDSQYYDKWVINYLKAQGLKVEETYDQREGSFIRVTW